MTKLLSICFSTASSRLFVLSIKLSFSKMNYKLTITLIIVQSIVYVTPLETFVEKDMEKLDCSLILSSMNFLYNQRCVQLIFGHELPSVQCIKKIMENSENVTFYIQSLSRLLNRNIYVEESSSNIVKGKSTKTCENFLKDVFSLQLILNSVKNNASIVTFFPYTKLYFMFIDTKVHVQQSQMAEISKFFYENAHFGYVYEFDYNSLTMKLRDFLSLDLGSQSNLIHPFVNRDNNQKEFRTSFYNCSPFIIYVDEENLR